MGIFFEYVLSYYGELDYYYTLLRFIMSPEKCPASKFFIASITLICLFIVISQTLFGVDLKLQV